MDRRKLRRLLASSSFAALLVASQSARAQGDLTNPAGNTVSFLRVAPGDTVDNVRNEGLIENEAGDPGIEVFGSAANPAVVLGEIDNEGDISISGTGSATGILVHGTSASVGEGIANHGRMDVRGSFTAYGIAIEGTNITVSGGGDGPAILNSGTLDILQRQTVGMALVSTAPAISIAVAINAEGEAAGIVATSNVTIDGAIVGEGDMTIAGTNNISVLLDAVAATGQAAANVVLGAEEDVAGISIANARLSGLSNDGSIAVSAHNNANLTLKAEGKTGATAIADLQFHANATGIALDVDTIEGAVVQEGGIDVDLVQSVRMTATALGPKAKVTAPSLTLEAEAHGIRLEGTLLDGNFDNDGDISVGLNDSAVLAAKATGEGTVTALIVVTTHDVTAHGIEIEVDTVLGTISNVGGIVVSAQGVGNVNARAVSDDGPAKATAVVTVNVEATGISIEGTSLNGGLVNHGDISAFAKADLIAIAFASNIASKAASASATALGGRADASGVQIDFDTATGDLRNFGDVRATALYAASAKGSAFGNTAARGNADIFGAGAGAVGVSMSLTTLFGSLSNAGDVVAIASMDIVAKGYASASAGKAEAGARFIDNISGSARGVELSVDDGVSGSISNSGNVAVQFKAAVDLHAEAKGAGAATANVSNAFGNASIDAGATGVLLNGDTIDGDLSNHGNVTASATALLQATALASGKTADAGAAFPFFPVAAGAQAVDVFAQTLEGSFVSSGDHRIFAEIDVSMKAAAKAQDGPAVAEVIGAGFNVDVGIVDFSVDTVTGTIKNSGSGLAIAGGFVAAYATATGEGKATAQIAFSIVEANATGLAINVNDAGGVTNDGSLELLIGVTLDLRASAVGSMAKASIPNAHAVNLEAAGMSVEANSLSGGIVNNGELTAAAVLSARATFGMEAYAKGSKAADAKAIWTSNSAFAFGLGIDVSTISGNVANNGEISVGAVVGERASATAIVKSGGTAHATAGVSRGSAVAVGFGVQAVSLDGDLINSGTVVGTAVAFLQVNALASATVKGNASAFASAKAINVRAFGVQGEIDTLLGDARNSGFVAAAARVSASLTAFATGESGNAKAAFDAGDLFAKAYTLAGETLDGDVHNSGALYAEFSLHLTVKATMSGAGSASANIGAQSIQAVGLDILADRVLGSVTNSADVTARAVLAVNATGKAGIAAQANIATQTAKATGLHVAAIGLDGDFLNSGRVLALASAKGRATVDGGASARIKATAQAMIAGTNDVLGDIINDGTLFASAIAVASAFANGGSGTAKAWARATGLNASDVGNFFGRVENNGLIQVKATAAATATAVGGHLQEAFATAIGIRAAATIQAEGGLINRGTILASAKADAPALAIGQVIVKTGIWHGALSNAQDAQIRVFASDASKATAIGMAIRGGAAVEGGVVNAGTIHAEAVSGDAHAIAIDLSQAIQTGNVVQMLDGALIAITRFTALSLTSAGTAVLMEGNAVADELDWSGGLIEANVIGTKGVDSMDVFAGVDDKFNFEQNISGLASLDVNTAAHAATAAELRLGGNVSNVTALNVNENGTLVMGVIGDATVETYNQDAGGTVFFEIGGPSQNGLITVTSKVNLAGAVGVRVRSGLYFNTQTYTVIAGNLSGQFDTILPINSPLLELVSVEDTSPDVTIVVERNAFDSVPGLTHNEKEIGGAIEDFYDPDALFGTEIGELVGNLFPLSTDELLDAYDDLAGAEHAQMAYAGFESMQFMQGGITQRLADARSRSSGGGQSAGVEALQYAAANATDEGLQGTQLAAIGNDPDHPGSVWGKGFGSWGSLDGDDEAPGYDRTTGAIIVGLDYRFDSDFLVGIAGAYSFSNLDFDDGDNGDVNSFQIGLFGSWDSGTWYVDGLVSYAFQSYETERSIDYIDEKAKADYDGGAVQVYGEVGYQFAVSEQGLITPLLGLGWTGVWTEDFTEKGAGAANLKVDEASYDSLATTLGVRGSLNLGGFEPSLFLGWRHEFLDDHGEADVAFAAVPDSKWQVIGSDVGSDAGLVGVGLVAEISDQFEVMADYSGQFSGGGSSNTGSIGLRFKF